MLYERVGHLRAGRADSVRIDARGLYYRELNEMVRAEIAAGAREIHLDNVNGQYYIGSGLKADVKIIIDGVPGNDLGAFMDGPTIVVLGNGQDNIGNTMNSGKIVVHGHAGDVLGYGMRGGKLFVREEVGYRVGIHMKGYQAQVPTLVAGGSAGDFLGEYMAGGILVVLGLKGNPTALNVLWFDPIHSDSTGRMLTSLRKKVLWHGTLKPFLGYARDQLRRLDDGMSVHGKGGKPSGKWAAHVLRILWQGLELAETGDLPKRMTYGITG